MCFTVVITNFVRQKEVVLTLYFAMPWNGQTHFKNLAANVARFLKCAWPFYDIAK